MPTSDWLLRDVACEGNVLLYNFLRNDAIRLVKSNNAHVMYIEVIPRRRCA